MRTPNGSKFHRFPTGPDEHIIRLDMRRPLKRVDIIAASCDKPHEAVLALRHCMKSFDFGRAILFTSVELKLADIEVISIPPLRSWHDYNAFILKLNRYIHNDFVMVVQDDGFIINADNWTDAFLEYDYIGAPWPAEESWFAIQSPVLVPLMRQSFPHNRVGNGGFSLRSRKFIEFSAQFDDCGGFPEDSFLCIRQFERAVIAGIRFSPLELAAVFSFETPLIEFGMRWDQPVALDVSQHFGFHGRNFQNSPALIDLKRQPV
jgi:hypothetical protein